MRLKQLTLRCEASAKNVLRKEDKESFPKDRMSRHGSLLTNNVDTPVANNQNVLTVGPRGPLLLQDA